MSYSKEEVIRWFSDLNVMNSGTVNNHLESLRKYGNNPVKSWTKIFAECMKDIGYDKDNYKNDQNMFLTKTNLTDDQLNEMNKREFVELFSKTMKSISLKNPMPPTNTQVKEEVEHEEVIDEDGCIKGKTQFDTVLGKCSDTHDGGSKKKSYKRAMRRTRHSRRSRRSHRSRRNDSRKYKKYNKR
jgi:hypothetical protein